MIPEQGGKDIVAHLAPRQIPPTILGIAIIFSGVPTRPRGRRNMRRKSEILKALDRREIRNFAVLRPRKRYCTLCGRGTTRGRLCGSCTEMYFARQRVP